MCRRCCTSPRVTRPTPLPQKSRPSGSRRKTRVARVIFRRAVPRPLGIPESLANASANHRSSERQQRGICGPCARQESASAQLVAHCDTHPSRNCEWAVTTSGWCRRCSGKGMWASRWVATRMLSRGPACVRSPANGLGRSEWHQPLPSLCRTRGRNLRSDIPAIVCVTCSQAFAAFGPRPASPITAFACRNIWPSPRAEMYAQVVAE